MGKTFFGPITAVGKVFQTSFRRHSAIIRLDDRKQTENAQYNKTKTNLHVFNVGSEQVGKVKWGKVKMRELGLFKTLIICH